MTRNIRVFLVTEGILSACRGFIFPIYVLYFRTFDVSLFGVALLAAVFEATILVAEIPTGLFADRFGRKPSVIIGFTLFALSGAVFTLFRQLEGFILGEILFGLAEAFISGAGEALAVDSIPTEERDGILTRLFTVRSRIRIGLTAVFMLIAGEIFSLDARLTFHPVFFGGVAGAIASAFFVTDRHHAPGISRPDFFAPIKLMFRRLKGVALLRTVFVISLVANFSFEGADQYWQVLAGEYDRFPVAWFGVITAAGALLAFLLVGRAVKRFSGTLALPALILLVTGVAISTMPNIPAAALPVLLVLYFIGRELIAPLFSITINRAIESEGRATFLSAYNLTCSMGEVAAGLVVGMIASSLGIPVVFVVCGGVLVMYIVVMLFTSGSLVERSGSSQPGH
jgi:MFS family permease